MKTIPRPSAPAKEVPALEEGWLYVPAEEVAEATSLGARMVEGDARLFLPSPLPRNVPLKAFDRWRGEEARYRWCMRYVAGILGERAPPPDARAVIGTLGRSVAYERVYLFVPAYDADRVRDEPGVRWDKRRRMYFATPEADLGRLFPWLTPAAQQAFEAEQVLARSLTLLVQDRARAEAAAGGPMGGGEDLGQTSGTPKIVREGSRTRA
jgi:hypothetical protein